MSVSSRYEGTQSTVPRAAGHLVISNANGELRTAKQAAPEIICRSRDAEIVTAAPYLICMLPATHHGQLQKASV